MADEYTLITGTPWTITDPQSRLVSLTEVEPGVYEATLTGGWGSYAADQCVTLAWPVLDPSGAVPNAEDEWVVSHRLFDMKPQAITDNIHFGVGVINKSTLTDGSVTGRILAMQSVSSRRCVSLQAFNAGALTQTQSTTNLPAIRGIEAHMTRPGRAQMHQSPPAVALDSYGDAVTTLFNSFTALTLGQGNQLYHCIQLGRNNALNTNQMTIRFRVYTRCDNPYKRRFQGIQMEGAPMSLWTMSDSSFSGYPGSKGMPFALQQLQLNSGLTTKLRPIRTVGTLTPGSSETYVMGTPRNNSLNGATAATLDTNTNTYLASLGKIDVFVLDAGINDIIAGTPVVDILVSLQSIIDKFNVSSNKNAGCKVYVANLYPGVTSTYDVQRAELNAGILLLTGTDGVIDQHTGWVTATMSQADGHPSYPATWSMTPDYTLGVWYQAKLVFTKIFGYDPGV